MASGLPNEILRQIVEEVNDLRRSEGLRSSTNLTSIAMVNHQWLAVVETIIWHRIRIESSEIEIFKNMLSRSSRRRSLCQLRIKSDNWFETGIRHVEDRSDDSEEEDSEDDYSSSNESSNIVRDSWRRWDDGVIAKEHGDLEERALFLQQELRRFFQVMGDFWHEMASWDQDLSLKELILDIRGSSIFHHLGRDFRAALAVQEHLFYQEWMNSFPSLPPLPSVLSLDLTSYIDGLSIAVAGCRLCKTLPNVHKFRLVSSDYDKTWYYARKHMREGCSIGLNPRQRANDAVVIASELATLPSSLRDMELDADFCSGTDQSIDVPSFLDGNVDRLSFALRILSLNLRKMALNLNHISPDLFFEAATYCATTPTATWPNLEEVYIVTGLEHAAGGYWLRPSNEVVSGVEYQDDRSYSNSPLDWDEEERLMRIFGDYRTCNHRDRPDPSRFDPLALSIARAISLMPKLQNFTMQFSSSLRFGDVPSEGFFAGWGFFFRSLAKPNPRVWYSELDFHLKAAVDWQEIRCPTAEWVFQCPFKQVQWDQPEEAKMLWLKRFPGVRLDIVTLERMERWEESRHDRIWQRWRDGKYVGLADKVR